MQAQAFGAPCLIKAYEAGVFGPVSPRASVSEQVCQNPGFLIELAREIRDLPLEEKVSAVLDKCAPFLRKGSLSSTARELCYMGLPDRALQTFSWAQKQAHPFPDDRLLASIGASK
ncbi:hypothetical protein CDL15_Pgr009417 [Punica granatum]|nr:hypothetical protein CDL15_Pgr009417 [Punica granatum]